MTAPIQEGDIIKIRESAGKRYTGYGVVTAKPSGSLLSFKRLIDRHGLPVNVGTKKVNAITINDCYCTVLDAADIDKMYEASLKLAADIREHLLANRRR